MDWSLWSRLHFYSIGVPLYYFVVLYRLRRYLNPQDADLEEISDDDVGEEQAALDAADNGGEAGLPCGDDDADDGGEAGLSSDLDDAGTEANEAKAADEVEQSSDDGVELPGGEEACGRGLSEEEGRGGSGGIHPPSELHISP